MSPRLAIVALLLTALQLPLSVLDWASLHDIWWDYASENVLVRYTEVSVASLPAWTRTVGEWDRVMLSLYGRTALLVVNAGVLAVAVLRSVRPRSG